MMERSGDVPDWLNVSRETIDDLVAFAALVKKWTSAVNLISAGSVSDIWQRHVLDSAQISVLAGTRAGAWVDVGSGGGFPALVLAIIAREASPETRFTLVESDRRKAAFLVQASQQLKLPTTVLVQRVESVPSLKVDTLSARAVAPLDALLGYSFRHLALGGRAYFAKGNSFKAEIDEAKSRWRFNITAHKSRTDSKSAILEVDGIEPL